jgi:hypothetical protein
VDRADAFVAFAPSADFDRARDLIARPTHGVAWPDRGGADNPLLPALQCGAPHPDGPGGRCGLSLTPMRTDEGDGYMYTSARCSSGERGHRTSFRPHIERPVLEMLATAYTPEAMAGAVQAVRARADAAGRELAALDRVLAEREADYARASKLETTAYREQNPLNIEHWGSERRAAQESVHALLQERAARKQAMADLVPEGGLERHLAVVRQVAASVPALIARSRPHLGMTSALVRLLTRSLTIRQAAPSVAVLEVEFPNATRAARVVLTGRVFCTQPERALAHHVCTHAYALAAGADGTAVGGAVPGGAPLDGAALGGTALEAAVVRLTRPADHHGPRLLLTPEKVVGFALLHRYFETVAPRMGPLETVPALAARVLVDPSVVEVAVLDGALGPAGVAAGPADGPSVVGAAACGGILLVAPTEAELEGALGEYARRRVEAREGWDDEDAARMRTLYKTHGIDAGAVKRGLGRELPGRYAYDLAGHLYVRLSAIPAKLRARADRGGDAAALRAAVEAATRRAMDAAGYGASTAPEDWWVAGALIKHLRTTVRVGSKPSLQKARSEGRILAISYRGPHPSGGSKPPTLLMYCPANIAHSGDAARVRAWFRGETPAPDARRRGRSDGGPDASAASETRPRWVITRPPTTRPPTGRPRACSAGAAMTDHDRCAASITDGTADRRRTAAHPPFRPILLHLRLEESTSCLPAAPTPRAPPRANPLRRCRP